MLSINFHLGVPPKISSIHLVSSELFSSTISINGSNSSTDALIPNKQETAIKAINKPYDLFNAKVISVKRVNKGRTPEEKKANEGMFDFIVKVQYRTYTGAHNPP